MTEREGIWHMVTSYFTTAELDAISIYHGATRAVTVANMSNVAKYLNNREMQHIMNLAVEKLKRLTEDEFKEMQFDYTEL